MQTVWRGKGDNKLIHNKNKTDRPVAAAAAATTTTTVDERRSGDVPHAVLIGYGPMCTEEKFIVLPYDVRLLIARTVDGWVKRRPANRLCVADCMVGSLTLMAHGTHQLYLSFDRFLKCSFDDDKLLRVLRCYKNCVPEPGTYLGEIVAQFFQHCKQQSNLDVKRTTRTTRAAAAAAVPSPVKRRRTKSSNGEEEEEEEEEEENRNDGDEEDEDGGGGTATGDDTRVKGKKSDIDKKFDVIMSLKKVATVVLMFRCTQVRRFLFSDEDNDEERDIRLKSYLKIKLFGAVPFGQVPYEFDIKQFDNRPGGEVYFSLTVYRKRKHDAILDDIFVSVREYNDRIRDRSAVHRLGICELVYCSDTLYFMDMSQTLFIDNSVTFLYCFLTDKYRPVIETKNDSFVFGLVKMLSSIEYFTKCSLKRSHNSKMGHGPLTSVISEGGLNESAKYTKAMFRRSLLSEEKVVAPPSSPLLDDDDDYCAPTSPTYDPQLSPPPCEYYDGGNGDGVDDSRPADENKRKFYVINEPYVNTFLNRPVECGSMY